MTNGKACNLSAPLDPAPDAHPFNWAAILSFVLPFIVHVIYIYHVFYSDGAYLHDAGWYAWLMHDGGWLLHNPPAIDGQSFYLNHVTPLLSVLALLTAPLPVNHVAVFACYLGTSVGLISSVCCLALQRWFLPGGGGMRSALAVALSLLFAGNGLSLVIAHYPHIEILIPALQMCFLYLWLAGRSRLALVPLAVGLLVREDAGFHFASLLGTMGLFGWFSAGPNSRPKRELLYAAGCCAVSLSMFTLQKVCFPNNAHLFRHIYLGEPTYAHVTGQMLAQRFALYATQRGYLWAPTLVCIAAGFVIRCAPVWLGLVAATPWVALHFLAYAAIPGSLFAYYAFPLFVGWSWLLFGPAWANQLAPTQRRGVLVLFALLSVVSLVMVQWQSGLVSVSFDQLSFRRGLGQAGKIDRILGELQKDQAQLGRIRSDSAFISLAPHLMPPGAWLLPDQPFSEIDTLFFFENFMDRSYINVYASTIAGGRALRIRGTHLMILTRCALPPEVEQQCERVPRVLLYQTLVQGEQSAEGYALSAKLNRGKALGSLFAQLPPGELTGTFTVRVDRQEGPRPSIRVYAHGDPEQSTPIASKEVQLHAGSNVVALSFSVPKEQRVASVCLDAPRDADVVVTDYQLTSEKSVVAPSGRTRP